MTTRQRLIDSKIDDRKCKAVGYLTDHFMAYRRALTVYRKSNYLPKELIKFEINYHYTITWYRL